MSEQHTALGHLMEHEGIFYLTGGAGGAGTDWSETGSGIVAGAGPGGGPHFLGGTTVNQGTLALGNWQQARDFLVDQDLDHPDMAGIREQLAGVDSHEQMRDLLHGPRGERIIAVLIGLQAAPPTGDPGEQARMSHGRTETVDKDETITIHGSHAAGEHEAGHGFYSLPEVGDEVLLRQSAPQAHGLTVGAAQEVTVGGFVDDRTGRSQEVALGGPDTTTRQQPGLLAVQEATQMESRFSGGDPDRPLIAGHAAAIELEDVMVSSLTVPAGDGNDQVETERGAHHGPGHEGVIMANTEGGPVRSPGVGENEGATLGGSAQPSGLFGDANGDGSVNAQDFAAARSSQQSPGHDSSLDRIGHGGEPRPFIMQDGEIVSRGVHAATPLDTWEHAATPPLADFNNDGAVDGADFAAVRGDGHGAGWTAPDSDVGMVTFESANPGGGDLDRMSHGGGPEPFIMQDREIVSRGVIMANTTGVHTPGGHGPLADFNNDGAVDGADFAAARGDGHGAGWTARDTDVGTVTFETANHGGGDLDRMSHGGGPQPFIMQDGEIVPRGVIMANTTGVHVGGAPGPEGIVKTGPGTLGKNEVSIESTEIAHEGAGVHVAAGDVNGDGPAERTAGPGDPHDGAFGGRFGDGKFAGLKEPGRVEYPNLAHAQGSEPAHLLPHVEQDSIVSPRDIASGIAVRDGTSNTIMFGEAASDPDDGPSTLLRHAAPGVGAGHDAHLSGMIEPSGKLHDIPGHAASSGDDIPMEHVTLNATAGHQPHEALHNLHIPDPADVLPEHDAGDIGHVHIHHGL